eukprot:1001-Heterococcus_DN1.PRE.6
MAFTPVQQPPVPPPLALSSPLASPFPSPPESPHDYHSVKYPLPIPSFVPPEYTAPQPPTETTCSSGSSNVAGSSSSGAAVSSAATTAANSDSESQEGGMTFREFLRGHMRESSEELSAAARSSEEPAAGGKGDASGEAAVPVQQLQGVVDVGVLNHDAVFWFGDLNYRIDMPVPQEEVFEKIKANDLDFLRDNDQLNMARLTGEAFDIFIEVWQLSHQRVDLLFPQQVVILCRSAHCQELVLVAVLQQHLVNCLSVHTSLEAYSTLHSSRASVIIASVWYAHDCQLEFLPTYKYQPGTHSYDTRPDKKVRAPAWCDRVLCWSRQSALVTQQRYYSSSEPRMSDHKPVGARYAVTVKQFDAEQRNTVFQYCQEYRQTVTVKHCAYTSVSRSCSAKSALLRAVAAAHKVVTAGAHVDSGACPLCFVVVLQELLKAVDKSESEAVPKVEITVLDESVKFGAVKYMCEAQSSYWLENTGDAIAYYRLYSSRAPARPLSATPRCLKHCESVALPQYLALHLGALCSQCFLLVSQQYLCVLLCKKYNCCKHSKQWRKHSIVCHSIVLAKTCCACSQLLKGLIVQNCMVRINAAVSTVPVEEYPTWYTAFPYQGMVIPGEKVEIKLCCLIGDTTARDLAAGLEHLEDELIIRIDLLVQHKLLTDYEVQSVQCGKDMHVAISAEYLPTVYGTTLEHMACGSNTTPRRRASVLTPPATTAAAVATTTEA